MAVALTLLMVGGVELGLTVVRLTGRETDKSKDPGRYPRFLVVSAGIVQLMLHAV